MNILTVLWIPGCATEAVEGCPSAGSVGRIEADITAQDTPGLCDSWCEVIIEGRLTLEQAVDEADVVCIAGVEGDLLIGGVELVEPLVLPRLRYVDGNVLLGTSGSVTTTDGLPQLTWVSGYFEIIHSGIEDISGLDALESVGSLSLYWNEHLTGISGLSALSEITTQL
ncbi:MAG: hypothetical protein ACI8RZ_003197, partial [Myxococcota bacterium]